MNTFKYNITFNPNKSNVNVAYEPKIDKSHQFDVGDTIIFNSTDAPWKVGYPNSPFNENGGASVFQGGKNKPFKATVLRGGRYSSDCGLFDGKTYVGYGDGGGDPVGPKG